MKWYHFSVEYFEDLRNINHCEFLIMNKQESGKYVLENKLRTWSELRKERALKKEKEKEKGSAATPTKKDSNKLDKALVAQSPITAPRRWGGCPNGCNHDKTFRIRSALAELVKRDGTAIYHDTPAANSASASGSNSTACLTHGNPTPPTTNGTSTPSSTLGLRRPAARRFQSEDDESSENEPRRHIRAPQIDVFKARDEAVSSPDGTPSFISLDDRLRAQDLKSPPAHGNGLTSRLQARGRDFGGSYSGQNSRANSDADSSEDEHMRRRRLNLSNNSSNGSNKNGEHHNLRVVTYKVDTLTLDTENVGTAVTGDENSKQRLGRRAMANRLGDSPVSSNDDGHNGHHCCAEHEHQEHEHADDEREKEAQDDIDEADELSDIDKAEREDKSIKGSVY